MMNLNETLSTSRILPVITPGDVATTVRLAQALSQGGMTAIEITLRSASALDCLRAVKEELPQLTLAALKSLAGPFPNVQFCPTRGAYPEEFSGFSGLAKRPLL